MLIFPAIDLYEGKAVRLLKGDYAKMTVYSEHPEEIAKDFIAQGASHIHIVDLEGAKSGQTPNFETVLRIKETSQAFCEIGGGVRSMEVVQKYIEAGLDRVILGTAALTNEALVKEAADRFREKIAVGLDLRDGFVSVKGWTETSSVNAFDFCEKMRSLGIQILICTDISKDGAMQGTNRKLYQDLANAFDLRFVASGGVSSLEDVEALKEMGLYGAIIGKAYYTGAVDLKKAVEVAE